MSAIFQPRLSLASRLPGNFRAECFDANGLSVFRDTRLKSTLGNQVNAVVSPRVPEGYYWWVFALNVNTDDGNTGNFDLYLMEPWQNLLTRSDGSIEFPTVNPGSTAPAAPTGFYKLVPPAGGINQHGLDFNSSGGGTNSTQSGRPAALPNAQLIIVPSRWRLVISDSGTNTGSRITLSFLYWQLRNRRPLPFPRLVH